MKTLPELLSHFPAKGSRRVRVHFDDDDESYWVGVKEPHHGMESQIRLASGMRKDVAELLLDSLKKLRDESGTAAGVAAPVEG